MPLSAIIMATSFSGGGSQSTRRECEEGRVGIQLIFITLPPFYAFPKPGLDCTNLN
jgi:hypothetical protein